jgi:hypothetical protein
MSVIIKCDPTPIEEGTLRCELWRYKGADPRPGDEAFVWTSETRGGRGLSYRGIVLSTAPSRATRGPGAAITVRIESLQPREPLTIEHLKADDIRSRPDAQTTGPRPGLWNKLHRNAVNKVADLLRDEADYLRSYF